MDKNIKAIEDYAFAGRSEIETLFYTGTDEELAGLKNSTGLLNEIYSSVITNYKPSIKVSSENEGEKKYTIEYLGIPIGETLIFAEYDINKMLRAEHKQLNSETVFSAKNNNVKEIKIFVWEDFFTATPVCKAKSISVK